MDWLKLVARKFRRFWKLDRNSRWLLLQAFILLSLVTLFLKFWKVKHAQIALIWLLPAPKISLYKSDHISKIKQTIQMVQLAAIYCQWAKCLPKSLVLWGLLRHQGIENSELRIGVRRDAENFEAHAWVECEGIALNDTLDVRSRFAMFDSPIEL